MEATGDFVYVGAVFVPSPDWYVLRKLVNEAIPFVHRKRIVELTAAAVLEPAGP